jgi:hypothetical protein
MSRSGKGCCGCFSVRTGAVIIAFLGIIGAGFGIISASVLLGVLQPRLDNVIDQAQQASTELVISFFVIQMVASIFNLFINGCMCMEYWKTSTV